VAEGKRAAKNYSPTMQPNKNFSPTMQPIVSHPQTFGINLQGMPPMHMMQGVHSVFPQPVSFCPYISKCTLILCPEIVFLNQFFFV